MPYAVSETLRKQVLNSVTFTVPKNRKPKFDLTLNILDLNNIPLVCGDAYVKWHLPSSSAAEHRGKTDKARIRDHRATWDYNKELSVKLTIDKSQWLQECDIHFEVIQEYHDIGRGGRVQLGTVTLNLAEYTVAADLPGDKEDNEDGMVTRRYLMQDSKINATLKIGIKMKQTEGDSNYVPPPLKSAMVIGGIAGIMNAEAGESEDMPSITAKTRELSEAQDIYRRTLAATWSCWSGELPPDRLVEDLFAGGDGGRMEPPPPAARMDPRNVPLNRNSGESDFSDADSKRTISQNHLSPETAKSGHHENHHRRHHHQHFGHAHHKHSGSYSSTITGVSGRGSIEQQVQMSQSGRRKDRQDTQELTEFDLRDNLKSWQVCVR